MNLGMIGAIGGAGAGLQQESKFLERQDEADAATARQKDFQGWLLQQQQQYEVQREQRTDRRAEEQKDRDFRRVQNEAPTRRDIKVEDEKASARGKSTVAAETVDTDAGVKQKLTDAGISTPDKGLKKAQADYYNDRGDAAVGKLDPADAAELKGVQARAGKLQETIDKAMAEPGGWDPATNPGQKQLQSNLAALRLRERTILQKYRPEGEAADPLGIRGKQPAAGGAPKPAPRPSGMLSQPGDADRAMILNQEMRKARERVASAKSQEERARAEGDVAALEREMRAAGVQVQAGAPAPAAPPRPAAPAAAPVAAAAPVDPTEALGRELDASRAELKDMRGKAPGLKAGAAAREQYAAKLQSLREKVRQQERRYADSVGGGGAAFVYR